MKRGRSHAQISYLVIVVERSAVVGVRMALVLVPYKGEPSKKYSWDKGLRFVTVYANMQQQKTRRADVAGWNGFHGFGKQAARKLRWQYPLILDDIFMLGSSQRITVLGSRLENLSFSSAPCLPWQQDGLVGIKYRHRFLYYVLHGYRDFLFI